VAKEEFNEAASAMLQWLLLPDDPSIQVDPDVRIFADAMDLPSGHTDHHAAFALVDFYYKPGALKPWSDRPCLSSDTVTLHVAGQYAGHFSRTTAARYHHMISDMRANPHRVEKPIQLDHLFELAAVNETLDDQNQWFCPVCRQHVCADKQMQIWSVGDLMALHLKRFTGGTDPRKIDVTVEFPDLVDMRPHVIGPQQNEDLIYRLYAVSKHSGGLHGGHYTAMGLVADQTRPVWFDFNDSTSRESSIDQTHTQLAYILFYERVRPGDPYVPSPAKRPIVEPPASGPPESQSDAQGATGDAATTTGAPEGND
jgi:hypothetical protein